MLSRSLMRISMPFGSMLQPVANSGINAPVAASVPIMYSYMGTNWICDCGDRPLPTLLDSNEGNCAPTTILSVAGVIATGAIAVGAGAAAVGAAPAGAWVAAGGAPVLLSSPSLEQAAASANTRIKTMGNAMSLIRNRLRINSSLPCVPLQRLTNLLHSLEFGQWLVTS